MCDPSMCDPSMCDPSMCDPSMDNTLKQAMYYQPIVSLII